MAATTLTDEQKVAILLASLDERLAASILQQLEPDVMAHVANAIRRLGFVSGEERKRALAECLTSILSVGHAVRGDDQVASSLLARAVGEKRAVAILQESTQTSGERFAGLRRMPTEEIVERLRREQPAAIAVVLRYLPPDKAGAILNALEPALRAPVVSTFCKSAPPTEEVLTNMEKYFESRWAAAPAKAVTQGPAAENVADTLASILQHVTRPVEEDVLHVVQETSEALATEVRDRLFTFEDITRLSDPAVRRLLQEIDTGVLAVALRKASESVKQKIFSNMSRRAGEALREEMEYAQKMKVSEVLAKQREIVAVIRQLEADGQISVGKGGEDDYV